MQQSELRTDFLANIMYTLHVYILYMCKCVWYIYSILLIYVTSTYFVLLTPLL